MEKFVCIHCHCYQPPRENPWLEAVEYQESAAPYHDWNERITAECYAPNAHARILDGDSRIKEIVNNYAKISFNFGPTLLSWMKQNEPDLHEAIVEADRASRARFSGHGSAMAQVYNHMILPLSNARDKATQVIWGIRDFESRFKRPPEGMWLAETAACTQSLEALADQGIKFTVLSPYQAHRIREIGSRNWRDVSGGRFDPTRAYKVSLPSGRSIAVFFYDGNISKAVAFEGLLTSGERLANRLVGAFSERRNRSQLVHIATDGESYGHHHKHGEMALAYALKMIEDKQLARLTNYAEFLEKYPPIHEVQIHENTAWSCVHGVGRWMHNCGCNSGGHGSWTQNWREPLRNGLDWLRDEVVPFFEKKASELLHQPWEARNDYICVILDRSPSYREKFFARHARKPLNDDEKITVLKLMELQRHAMLMYTSCGWFFDELSGIETVQVIQYAARVVQLARDLFHHDFEPGFLERLDLAKSNIPQFGSGRAIYERFVKPAMVDWERVVAHYGISSVFESYAEKTKIYLYQIEDANRQVLPAGKTRLVIGQPEVTFEITREKAQFTYAVLHMGEHNLCGGVSQNFLPEAYQAMTQELKDAFDRADFPEVIRAMDRHFGESHYSLQTLFKDEQLKVLDQILASTREDLENRFRLITERYTPLMKFLRGLNAPLPPGLETAADFVLKADLYRAFAEEQTDLGRLRSLCDEAISRGAAGHVFDDDLCYTVTLQLEKMMRRLTVKPEKMSLLKQLEGMVGIVISLPLSLNWARIQNTWYKLLLSVFPQMQAKAAQGEKDAQTWVQFFVALSRHLNFATPAAATEAAIPIAA